MRQKRTTFQTMLRLQRGRRPKQRCRRPNDRDRNHEIHRLRRRPQMICSNANLSIRNCLIAATLPDFVSSLGCYDEVVTYDRATSLPANSAVAFIDMAGNSALRETLRRHFGDQMKYS